MTFSHASAHTCRLLIRNHSGTSLTLANTGCSDASCGAKGPNDQNPFNVDGSLPAHNPGKLFYADSTNPCVKKSAWIARLELSYGSGGQNYAYATYQYNPGSAFTFLNSGMPRNSPICLLSHVEPAGNQLTVLVYDVVKNKPCGPR